MEEKGYVVCLLKYILGDGDSDGPSYWDNASENRKPIALGYFGRVDVAPVFRFKDYMNVASTYNAQFTGSRKQLLLYPLFDKEESQVCWQAFDVKDGGKLPFQPLSDSRRPCFCCLSILNISQSVKDALCSVDYAIGIRKIAQCLSEQLEQHIKGRGAGAWMPFAVMGLLGTEDLCLISLSDDFTVICEAVSHLRSLTAGEGGEFLIENSHSIQMVDFSAQAARPKWGKTKAEIHFSLKTNDGMAYLEKLRDEIGKHADGQEVCLENQIGEYDAVIRCPASALGPCLYGYGQALSYNDPTYRNAAYQSETLLYQPLDGIPPKRIPVELPGAPFKRGGGDPRPGECAEAEIENWMKERLGEIERCIQEVPPGEPDSTYITQVLYRLLKDFMRIASIPFGGSFQQDLRVQFQATINAVVCAARQYQRPLAGYNGMAQNWFDNSFPRIIDALSSSMQAANQIDRLYFEEQQSHLQNTGAYHKVLLAYYGIVKTLLQFVYGISRAPDSKQPVLIPLLSFGHAQIICSKAFDTEYEDKPARLLCITLPYQALSNIPKYIGPLAHEIFHYSTPSDRKMKNEAAGKCLTAVAFRSFLDEVGAAAKCGGRSGSIIFSRYRGEFLDTVSDLFKNILLNLIEQLPAGSPDAPRKATSADIVSELLFRGMRIALSPWRYASSGNAVEQMYCEGWLELRKRLKEIAGEDKRAVLMFALDKELSDDEARAHIRKVYQDSLPTMADSIPACMGIYEMALREVPPDLFDIGLVMRGMTDEERIEQYLWQIHSIRSDKLYYSGRPEMKVEGNSIRFGIVLDYLAFGLTDGDPGSKTESRRARIQHMLEKLGSDRAVGERQKAEWKKNCKAVLSEYNKYFEDSPFINELFKDYIQRVKNQLEILSGSGDLQPALERLSGFYGEYCKARAGASDKACGAALMELSLRIIEAYQCQPRLAELSKLCGSTPDLAPGTAAVHVDGGYSTWEHEIMAFGPQDLSAKIVNVYAAMRLKNKEPLLWFRGQRLEGRALLPNIMREGKAEGFQLGMRRMTTLAKAKILPQGRDFHSAEWLALLQHHLFKTNLLDWSEDLHSAVFFAIERWIEDLKRAEEGNAAISVLNPILYNLVKDVLETKEGKGDPYDKALQRLKAYWKSGDDRDGEYAVPLFASGQDCAECQCYYDLNTPDNGSIRFPIAAMTPASNDRMKRQAGVFTFCDVRAKPKMLADGSYTYEDHELSHIQARYFDWAEENGFRQQAAPFLLKLVLSSANAKEFVSYVRAIGMRKYRMYPELDKLAGDIMDQSL